MEMSSFVLIKMSRMINNKVNINIDVFVFWTTLHTISRQSQYLSTCASLDELGVIRGGQIFPLWKQSVNTRIFHDSHDIGLLFKPGRRLPLQALLSEKLNLVILLFLFWPFLCWALCCTPTHPRWTPLPLVLLLNIMFVVLALVGHRVGRPTHPSWTPCWKLTHPYLTLADSVLDRSCSPQGFWFCGPCSFVWKI